MLPAIIVMTAIGLIAGISLAVASKYFNVKKDPLIEEINSLLPRANCGSCGFGGCIVMAKAMASGELPANACPIAESDVVAKISSLTGKVAEALEKRVAVVLCDGGCKAIDRYTHYGLQDCYSMAMTMGGVKSCTFGCVGGGSCVKVCPFDAMVMGENGLPVIFREKCTGCGLCVDECPKKVIALKSITDKVCVLCLSADKGAETKKVCSVGCIGCGICEKVCPDEAINVKDNAIALLDGKKCSACGKCVEKCPTKIIQFIRDN